MCSLKPLGTQTGSGGHAAVAPTPSRPFAHWAHSILQG